MKGVQVTQQEELTVNLAIRVTPSMLEALRAMSKTEDRPVGWLVRKAISIMLEGQDAD